MHLNLYTWKKPIWNYLVCLLLVFHRYLQYIHWPIANNCIYFCLCDTLPLHIKLPAIAFEIWWFLVSSFNYLLKFFSSPCEYLFNAFWISYEVLMMLGNFWSKFCWISDEFLWISYEFRMIFWWISDEFLWISYEFLMNFWWISHEFLWNSMKFLWICYAVLTQFLCSSYAVLM